MAQATPDRRLRRTGVFISDKWLRGWASEILAEALEKPVAGDQLSLPLSGKVILVYHDC